MRATRYSARKASQQGFVAIFTTLVIMGILTLLTIGFTFITRQAQRRTLDDQLNAQAFYAAESGVNAARTQLETNTSYSKSDCGPDATITNYSVDPAINSRVTCLLVDSDPARIIFDNVPTADRGEPIFFQAQIPAGATGINSVAISWDATTSRPSLPNTGAPLPGTAYSDGAHLFTPAATWGNQVGIMRVDILPVGALDRASLVNNSYTFFLYPNPVGSAGNIINPGTGPSNQGTILSATCTTNADADGYRCRRVLGLTGAGGNQFNYYIRMQAYYNTVKTEVEFFTSNNGSGTALEIRQGQALIDATGESNGVYRRVQVRAPIGISNGFSPPQALYTADSICKRFMTSPSGSALDPTVPVTQACDIFSP